MQLFTAMGRGNDDSERVQQLQAQLEQERIERQQILEKVNKLEENQVNLVQHYLKIRRFTNILVC